MAKFQFLKTAFFGTLFLIFSHPSAAVETVAEAIRHTTDDPVEKTSGETPENRAADAKSSAATTLEDLNRAIDDEQ